MVKSDGSTAQIANGTLTLTASATSYIVAAKATGAVSAATTTTNWDNAADYWRLYSVVAGASTVTSYTDSRTMGAFQGAGSGGGGGMSNPMTTAGDIITGGASGAPQRLAAGTNGHVLKMVSGAPVWAAEGGGSSVTTAIPIAVSDETTALTTGTAKVTFRMPFAFTLTAVRASVTTAPTGSVLTVDINEGGASILSTKLTIDAGEKTSVTAATPAVISDTALADDAEITIDIDTVGSTVAGAGLKVYLIGTVV